ncbi:hypothetical protein C8A01DRAFT_46227 [Parachaetomium inaequale]|uniref:Uncharacterized protein n=1 Tax=Parachaetomium inaequale TaxID=2588326 RepID=A0AAN6PG97_9PEZI|nr:hypothetical protein C8A01DRAFT_46227 [Parachaetomium inaequale]
MPRRKRQKRNRPTANLAAGSPADTIPFAAPTIDPWARRGPSETYSAACCRKDQGWNGPSVERLDRFGCWTPLTTRVGLQAESIQRLGLTPWRDLSRSVQTRLKSWSPTAKQLWQSDFVAHRKAMVRAWIWHYLNNFLFSFVGDAQDEVLVPLSSSTWERVRALRRDLDVLRTRHDTFDDPVYRIQFHAWSRMTEHLVRRGLGQEDPLTPPCLVAYFKASLRQIVANADVEIPDDANDGDLNYLGDPRNPRDASNEDIKCLLRYALQAQYFLHRMPGSYTLRFSAIGSDKTFGFPFDKNWMRLNNARQVPNTRPGEPLPLVQLVSDPMLVASGLDGLGYDKDFTLRTPMQVVTPWTFGGKEAETFIYPGYEKGWELAPAGVQVEGQVKPRVEAEKESE